MDFTFDRQNVPDNLTSDDAQDAFVDAALALMQKTAPATKKTEPVFAAVVGMLINDGFNDPTSNAFARAFWSIRGEAAGTTVGYDGKTVDNAVLYAGVAKA